MLEAQSVMVFDRSMNPAWSGKPEACRRWIRYKIAEESNSMSGFKVRVDLGPRFDFVPAVKYMNQNGGEKNGD